MTPPSPMVVAVAQKLVGAYGQHSVAVALAPSLILTVLDNMDVAVMAEGYMPVNWRSLSPQLREQHLNGMRAAIAAVRAQVGETEGR